MTTDAHKNNKQAQEKLQKQMKYMPYFLIFDFALITTCLRLYLAPEWGWWHLPLFFYQCMLFIGLWHLIKLINKKLNKYFSFEQGPLLRISFQIIISAICISPIIIGGFWVSRTYGDQLVNEATHKLVVNTEFMAVMTMMVLVVLIMFNFAFYALHFFEHWQRTVNEKASLEIQAAELEKEKSGLQYHQLKNQVNPHYLFNMLTSLDGLVHTNPDLASDFIRHMSKVYRYVLQHKESEVVNVDEELDFIGHYIELLTIRYGKGLTIDIQVPNDVCEKGIVMITLQMLIDNAIKHNIVQSTAPLNITICSEDDYIIVRNNKQLRKQMETSNRTGLEQLKQLYAFLTEEQIIVEDTAEEYMIKIPLL